MKPQVKVLIDCIDIIKDDKLNYDVTADMDWIAYSQLLDWIAVKLSYEVQVVTPAFQQQTHDALAATFNVDLLKEEVWDWFGEAAIELGFAQHLPGTDMDKEDVRIFTQSFAQYSVPNLKGLERSPVLDPIIGTGRIMLGHAEWKDQIMIYGVEKNKISYRTALLNARIHGFNAFILHADPAVHYLGIDSRNWLAASQWYPIAFNELL